MAEGTAKGATGSTTQTIADSPQSVLHLRANIDVSQTENTAQDETHDSNLRPRVRWSEDTIDNENMGKKKSKICCIFHPNREFGESSDESLSSPSDSSDESGDEKNTGKPEKNGSRKDKNNKHRRHCRGHDPEGSMPNAYERQPKYKNQSVLPDNAI